MAAAMSRVAYKDAPSERSMMQGGMPYASRSTIFAPSLSTKSPFSDSSSMTGCILSL